MAKLPYFKFFAADWLADAELRRCSFAARGFFIDMLAIMWQCQRRGVLETNGRPWSDAEIVVAMGGDSKDSAPLLTELLANHVARRSSNGAVYSKRLIEIGADLELAHERRVQAGSKGGYRKQHAVVASKPPVKKTSAETVAMLPQVRSQKLEVRSQKLKTETTTATAFEKPAAVLSFKCLGMPREWELTQEYLDELKAMYPTLDVMAEVLSSKSWLLANPGRWKTAKGMPRFLDGWLRRSWGSSRSPSARSDEAYKMRGRVDTIQEGDPTGGEEEAVPT